MILLSVNNTAKAFAETKEFHCASRMVTRRNLQIIGAADFTVCMPFTRPSQHLQAGLWPRSQRLGLEAASRRPDASPRSRGLAPRSRSRA